MAVPSGRDFSPDSLDEVGAYCGGVSRTKTFMTGGVGSNNTTRPKSSLKARLRLWGRTAVHTHRPCTASGRAQPLQDHPTRSLAGKAPRVPRPGWGRLFYPLLPGQGWSCGSAGATPTPMSTLTWAPLAAGRAPPSRLRLGPQGRTGPGPYVVPPPAAEQTGVPSPASWAGILSEPSSQT